jgi:hypothetical protein
MEKALEMLGGDPAKRKLAERIVVAGQSIGPAIANARTQCGTVNKDDISRER